MTIQQFIEKAIAGGWQNKQDVDRTISMFSRRFGETTAYRAWYSMMFLDPLAWQAVGKVEGWNTSKYRMCEMKMPFYHNEKMRGTGVIVGESKDKKQWYVRWNYKMSGESAKGMTKQPYPKEYIIEKSSSDNWLMVWHRMIDALTEGRTIVEFLETL